jgi:pseudouridine kinase
MGGVLCIGGAAIDLGLRLSAPPILGTSNLADAASSFGGVARNVAELLARFGAAASLLGAVGEDAVGAELLAHLRAVGVDTTRSIVVPGGETARYVAVLDTDGELVIGVNAMQVTSAITADRIRAADLASVDWLFAECNLDADALTAVLERRRGDHALRLAIDTISVPKVARLPRDLTGIDLLFTNVDEANALLDRDEPRSRVGGLALSSALLQRGIAAAVVTLGDRGHVVRTAEGAWWSGSVTAEVVDVTGAGDALIAGTLTGIQRGLALAAAARDGALAAALTTESPHVAPPELTLARLDAVRARLDATPMEGPLP